MKPGLYLLHNAHARGSRELAAALAREPGVVVVDYYARRHELPYAVRALPALLYVPETGAARARYDPTPAAVAEDPATWDEVAPTTPPAAPDPGARLDGLAAQLAALGQRVRELEEEVRHGRPAQGR